MNTSESRRLYKRTRGYAPVSCDGIQGRLIDISRDGLAFSVKTSFKHFTNGKICQLNIKIPRSRNNPEGIGVDFPGVICRTQMDDDKNRLIVGVNLEGLPKESQALINRIILFFAQNFQSLQSLTDFFNSLESEAEPVLGKAHFPSLKKQEIRQFYQELFDQLTPLPMPLKRMIERHIQEIKNSLESGKTGISSKTHAVNNDEFPSV